MCCVELTARTGQRRGLLVYVGVQDVFGHQVAADGR